MGEGRTIRRRHYSSVPPGGASSGRFFSLQVFSGNLFSLDITCVCRLGLVLLFQYLTEAAPPEKRRATRAANRARHKTSAPPHDTQPHTLSRCCVSDTHGTFVPAQVSAQPTAEWAGCKLPRKFTCTWVMMNGQGVNLTSRPHLNLAF